MKLTDHQRRILEFMELGKWYPCFKFRKPLFPQGVQDRVMDDLKRRGYLELSALPCPGHEDDWRQTGRWWRCYRKLKDPEGWFYEI